MKMVRCIICGAVFEEGPEVCPVCGMGKENFVPAEEAAAFKKNTEEIFLVLGGGAAAVTAAEAIRERNDTCSIVMISDEGRPPCNRPMLTKSIGAGLPEEGMDVHPESWYGEKSIYTMFDKEVTALDPRKKEVTCAGGEVFSYHKCIYALGARPFVPPMEGTGLPGVFSIRRIEDVEGILALLPEARRAVVVGGGVLGLEAAWGLRQAGCQVTVLESGSRIMSRQLDEGASALLESIMAEKGVILKKEARSEAVLEKDGRAAGIRLKGGEELPAELVILSTGVRPNVAVAETAGLAIGKSVAVNEKMETSAPDVYACGDCAEFDGVNYSLWSQAVEMGKVAGANAAGDSLAYETVDGALTFSGMGTSLFSMGDNGKGQDREYQVREKGDPEAGLYEKYYFLDGRLCGVILIGDISRMGTLSRQLK
ncbi:MAG: FAD-dependent oxidoreductase, partial [Bacillota bacterium]|nr:FAD-dependent oxidoreductase [Bacillota bacterium]